jgi:hypothetical protein
LVHSGLKQFWCFVERSLDSSLVLMVRVVDDSRSLEQVRIRDVLVRYRTVGTAMLSRNCTAPRYFAKVPEDYTVQHGVPRMQLM